VLVHDKLLSHLARGHPADKGGEGLMTQISTNEFDARLSKIEGQLARVAELNSGLDEIRERVGKLSHALEGQIAPLFAHPSAQPMSHPIGNPFRVRQCPN